MSAMAIIITRGAELIRCSTRHSAIGGKHLIRADQLIVACERCIIRIPRRVTKITGQRTCRGCRETAVIGKRGMLGPDAGIDDANHHTLDRYNPLRYAPPGAVRPRKVGLLSVSA